MRKCVAKAQRGPAEQTIPPKSRLGHDPKLEHAVQSGAANQLSSAAGERCQRHLCGGSSEAGGSSR